MTLVPPSFDITVDAVPGVMVVELVGFWSLGTVASFTTQVMKVGIATRLRHGSFDVLCDLSRFSVQSQEVATAFRTFIGATKILNSGKIAVVYVSALVGAQIKRDSNIAAMRYFTVRQEAEDWLAAG